MILDMNKEKLLHTAQETQMKDQEKDILHILMYYTCTINHYSKLSFLNLMCGPFSRGATIQKV